jgi:hypothetical protein
MRSARRGVCALLLALAFAPACDAPAGLGAEQVCDAYCECVAPLPTAHAACVGKCEAQVGPIVIPDACIACLDEPVCSLLEGCLDTCMPSPPPGGP